MNWEDMRKSYEGIIWKTICAAQRCWDLEDGR